MSPCSPLSASTNGWMNQRLGLTPVAVSSWFGPVNFHGCVTNWRLQVILIARPSRKTYPDPLLRGWLWKSPATLSRLPLSLRNEWTDEILPVANDTNYGLAAGVFTRDISKAHRTAKRLRAGTVWINTYHVFDAAMPFGGYKESGWGREMGSQVLNNYLETKSVVTALS